MRTFKSIAAVVALGVVAAGAASADDSNFGVGIKAGTLGLGVEGRWDGLPWLDFRLGANAYSIDDEGREANNFYQSELELETIYLTANFHFPLSPFRLTVGAMSNGNELRLVGAETGDYNFGGQTWTQGQVGILTSTTSFASTAPYVGLGFDFELFGKAGLNFDLGVLLQGEPEVTLVSTGTAGGDPLLGDAFAAALEAERQELEDDMSSFKAYPVISLAFVYNF
ncbi:MAG TPA: hypothetical protein VLA06_05725 [Woeseiaceae bacterium]|jgi:hypothetical protein|nr:hypothetical protein [Woeseiaceae bacterium]